jgi:Zn-dependent protease/CBS domain-containing protein
MDSSVPLFRIKGIAVRMHMTFPLILIWAALQYGFLARQGWMGAAFGVIVTLLLFVIVVLHELGHSTAALRYGVPVRQIVLLPIGGVAQLERMPENPAQELVIAFAGPLVNFLLAVILAGAGLAAGADLHPGAMLQSLEGLGNGSPASVYGYVFISNLFLGIFNLLPAFPMDGGRMLRALLAIRLPYLRATSIAVTIGQGLAWVLGLWGFLGGGFFLILIAIFIFLGAGQERRMIQVRSVLGGFIVGQAYTRHCAALRPSDPLTEAINLTLRSFQSDFPVCDGEEFLGLLTHAGLVQALHHQGPNTPVAQVMQTGLPPVNRAEGLFDVQQRMAGRKVDALPVVENGRFLGLITNRDINEVYRLLSSRQDFQPSQAR